MYKILFVLIFFYSSLCISQSIKGFQIADSLKNQDFEQLEKNFEKNIYRLSFIRAFKGYTIIWLVSKLKIN